MADISSEGGKLLSNGLPVATESQVLGVGQTWQDVKASRLGSDVNGTTNIYTNNSGKPISVKVSSSYTTGVNNKAWVDGLLIEDNSPSVSTSACTAVSSFIVPSGSTYAVYLKNGGIASWVELR